MEDNKYTITTDSGFSCTIDDGVLDDLELFEDLTIMEDPKRNEAEQLIAGKRVVQALIGEDQEKSLREHLREKEGKVKITSYLREFGNMFREIKETKKK